jgi:ribosomal protein S12 methylthiotransferase accessory factor
MIILPVWNRQLPPADCSQFYRRLVPLIDGRTTSDSIVDRLSGQMAAEHVYYALLQLQRLGLIRDAVQKPAVAPMRLSRSQKAPGSHRACPARETIRRLRPFVKPDGPVEPAPWTLGESLGWVPRIEAEARRLAEAIERHCCRFQSGEIHARMSPAEALGRAVLPSALLHFSAAQYRRRSAWNRTHRALNRIPRPLDKSQIIDWTHGWSLTRRCEVLLPSAYCFFSFPVGESARYCYADSNGCAAGNTREEAILTGFLELVERDAVCLWWYNRIRRPKVDLQSFRDRFFASVARSLSSRGRVLEVLDITTDIGVPSFAAVSWLADGSTIVFGFGAHLNPREAIRHALVELGQMLAYEGETRELARWYKGATIHNQQFMIPQDGWPRTASDYRALDRVDLRDDVRTCVRLASRAGLEVVVLDLTRPEIGFPVVRVIVPGLRSFAARFGPGRLYDVPVQLGWLDTPRSETEMNPIPFFL